MYLRKSQEIVQPYQLIRTDKEEKRVMYPQLLIDVLDSLSIQLIKVSQELSDSHMSTADRGQRNAIQNRVSAMLTVLVNDAIC